MTVIPVRTVVRTNTFEDAQVQMVQMEPRNELKHNKISIKKAFEIFSEQFENEMLQIAQIQRRPADAVLFRRSS